MTHSTPSLATSPRITPQPGGAASSAPEGPIYSSAPDAISSYQSGVAAASLAGRVTAATVPSAEQTFHDKVAALLKAVERNGLPVHYGCIELENNHEIVLAAVKQDGRALRFASRELRPFQHEVQQ